MMNKTRRLKFLSLVFAAAGFLLASGDALKVSAQRDPFAKQNAPAPRSSNGLPSGKTSGSTHVRVAAEKPKPSAPMPVEAPAIQDRIAYYKRLREAAAMQNQPIPKPTSVMTLDELSVTGIFRTPRGYAAMVEAKPIKLSYTIYPGEKFFDGQLVAIEENRLVFRRVTKWSNGKFVASEENKPLRQYTVDQQVQGTAPVEPSGKTETAASAPVAPTDDKAKSVAPVVVSSPLEEMNRQSADPKNAAKAKTDKKGRANSSKKSAADKKSVKIAANKDE